MSAEKLIQLTAAGDRNAYEKLYREYRGLIFAVALSVTRNRHDAEDATVDAFVAVYKNAGGYLGGNGKAWLCSIARNTALTLLRKRRSETLSDMSDESEFGWQRFEAQSEAKMTVDAALAILDGDERETVLMKNAGLKHREIADIRGESIGTVTWRYNAALQKMRTYLTGGR